MLHIRSSRRPSRVGMGVGLAAVLAACPALADSFAGTRFDLRERVHDVDVRVEHGHSTLVVTRTVENAAPKSDQAVFHIDLPEGAVATRLRTAGTNARGEQVWFEGELMRDAKVEACVAEQLWTVALPSDFHEEHQTWRASSRP